MEDDGYKNKNSQAPSYCDRIMIKNNTKNDFKSNFYMSNENLLGSDHRPVWFSCNLKQEEKKQD